MTTHEETVSLITTVPITTRQRVKVQAALKGVTMQQFVNEALEAALTKSEEETGTGDALSG